MSRSLAPRPVVLLVTAALLLSAGCGDEPLHATPHGMTIKEVASTPAGDAVEVPSHPTEGVWKAVIRKQWVETRDAGAPKTGRAVLALTLERTRDEGVLVSRVRIQVTESEGSAARLLRDFDGLAYTIRHGEDGRPDPATIRFEAKATAKAQTFLSGFWSGGLTGVAPWIPDQPIRLNETWSRADLGAEASLRAVLGAEGARPRLLGGGRLDLLAGAQGARTMHVVLDTLVDVETSSRREALSLGILDRGTLTLDARSGLPVRWSLEEHVRMNRATRTAESAIDVTLRVDGEVERVDR